jgi:hypothetical protein
VADRADVQPLIDRPPAGTVTGEEQEMVQETEAPDWRRDWMGREVEVEAGTRRVVAVTLADSPLGNGIKYKQILELTLEGGGVVYGCIHCPKTLATRHKVRSHLTAHSPRGANRERQAVGKALDVISSMSVQEIVDRLGEVDDLRKERDEWKRRAQEAERNLRPFVNAIRSVTQGQGGK